MFHKSFLAVPVQEHVWNHLKVLPFAIFFQTEIAEQLSRNVVAFNHGLHNCRDNK